MNNGLTGSKGVLSKGRKSQYQQNNQNLNPNRKSLVLHTNGKSIGNRSIISQKSISSGHSIGIPGLGQGNMNFTNRGGPSGPPGPGSMRKFGSVNIHQDSYPVSSSTWHKYGSLHF